MLDQDLLRSIAAQLMSGNTVQVEGKGLPVWRTRQQRLKTVSFTMRGRKYQAIEQNPDKPSSWAQLARSLDIKWCSSRTFRQIDSLRSRWMEK